MNGVHYQSVLIEFAIIPSNFKSETLTKTMETTKHSETLNYKRHGTKKITKSRPRKQKEILY